MNQHNEFIGSRYYTQDNIINKRTGLAYIPSVTSILQYLPEPYNLKKWRADLGMEEAKRYMMHRAGIGSYVHDKVEQSLLGQSFKYGDIFDECMLQWDQEDTNFILGALQGWMNFLNNEKPKNIITEQSFCTDEYAGTVDLVFEIDGKKFTTDIKTSKQANEHHYIQVEAYRRTNDSELGGVLVLGNTTKNKYTFTQIPKSKYEHHWELFKWAMDGFYLHEKGEPKKMVYFDEFKS